MVTSTTTEKYRVVLTVAPWLTRRECRTCGGVVEKDEVVATIDGPHRNGKIYAVCHDCLRAGPEGIAERMNEYAESLEERADILRYQARGEWVMPSLDDLRSFD